MNKIQNTKQYDLEERTLKFAKKVIEFINKLPRTLTNIEISKQLVKAAGSVGANYIEANESLSKKRFHNEDKDLSKRSKRKPLLVETCQLQ